ncbi:kinesin [Thraustotheca clavata]|uniref:Kinesin n=1 Tax=Thraustotheca clavata TaxID=74557 RepID=A0A1V9YT75_9STRA|nr:kinesin [Thraustotheca clavata]
MDELPTSFSSTKKPLYNKDNKKKMNMNQSQGRGSHQFNKRHNQNKRLKHTTESKEERVMNRYGKSLYRSSFVQDPWKELLDFHHDVLKLKMLVQTSPYLLYTKIFGNGKRTALYIASLLGSLECVRLLLNLGADPQITCEGYAPVDVAGMCIKDIVVKMKIKHLFGGRLFQHFSSLNNFVAFSNPKVVLQHKMNDCKRIRVDIHFSEAIWDFTMTDIVLEGCKCTSFNMYTQDHFVIQIQIEDFRIGKATSIHLLCSMEENIAVCIRVRPLNERERRNKDASVLRVLPALNAVSITDRNGTPLQGPSAVFQYDHIFQQVPTRTIYDEVARRIVESSLHGINGTIFAYGQTSSGKTHTMMGTQAEPGILPLAVQHIFQFIADSANRDFLIRVSYVEIYNEVIRDLLSDDKEKSQNIKIREDPKKGIYLEAHEEYITDFDKLMTVVEQGDQRRAVGQTAMNEHSSRSHSIFQIVIESKERSDEEDGVAYLVGVLNLVDLAGSESVRHTSSEGLRQREAGNINRSLLTLARVINSLAQGPESIQSAPFRDSKLTRLLQNSLAGSTRTLIICCVTPSDKHLEESKSTLQFAQRAKTIQMTAAVNEVLDDQAQMKRLQQEVTQLRKQLNGDDTLNALKAQNLALAEEKQRQQAKIERLQGLIMTGSRSIESSPDVPKQKTKRVRETWGPGHILATTSTLDDFQSLLKKRKERHSEGSVAPDKDVEELKRDLAEAKLLLLAKDKAIVSSEQAVTEFDALLNTMASDREMLAKKNLEQVEIIAELQLELQKQTQAASTYKEMLDTAGSSRNELEDEYKNQTDKFMMLEETCDILKAQISELEAREKELQVQYDEQNQYIIELEKDHTQLREHYAEELQSAKSSHQADSTLQAALDQALDELKQADAVHAKLEAQIEALQIENESLTSNGTNKLEAEALQFQLESLQKQLDSELDRRVELETEWEAKSDTLSQEIQSLTEQIKLEKEEKATLEETLTNQIRSIEEDLEHALTEHSVEVQKYQEKLQFGDEEKAAMEIGFTSCKNTLESEFREEIESLNAQLKEKSEGYELVKNQLELEIKQLQEVLNAAEGTAAEQSASLQVKCDELVAEKEELTQELFRVNKKVESLVMAQEDWFSERNSLHEARQALELSLSEAQDKVTRLAFLESQAFEEKKALQLKIQALESEKDDLTAAHNNSSESDRNELYSARVEIQKLSEQIKALELDKHMTESASSSEKTLLKSKIVSLKDAIATLIAEKDEAKVEFESMSNRALENRQKERAELQDHISTLENTLHEKEIALETKVKALANLESTLSQNQDELYTLSVQQRQAIADANKQAEQAKAEIAALHDQVKKLTAQIETQSKDYLLLKESIENNVHEQTSELSAQAQALQTRDTELSKQLNEQQKMIEAYETQVTTLDKEMKELVYEKTVLEKDLQEVRTSMAEMDEEHRKEVHEVKLDAQQQIAQIVEEKAMLYEQIDSIELDIKRVRKELEHVTSTEKHVRTELASSQSELEIARARIAKLELVKMTKHHLEVFQTLKQDNKRKAAEIASLSAKLSTAPTTSTQMQSLEAQLRFEQTKKVALETQLEEYKVKLKTMQNECQIKMAEAESLQKTIEQYMAEIKVQDDQLLSMKVELDNTTTKLLEAKSIEIQAKENMTLDIQLLEKENLTLHQENKHLRQLLATDPLKKPSLPAIRYDNPSPAKPTTTTPLKERSLNPTKENAPECNQQ